MTHLPANWSLKNSLTLVLLGAVCLLAGCGPNPAGQAKPARPEGNAANAAETPDGQAAPAADRPAAKTPLIGGLSGLLESNPALEDDTKQPLRDQLQQADDILSKAKAQNRAALRQVNRQQRVRRSDSPNIVMIIADDLGIAELNCYGESEIKTPHIDQLAKLGTRFTQFYAGSPYPIAAHWCLATGRRPDEATAWSKAVPVLQAEDVTMAETMWQAGYTTAMFGDWGVLGAQGAATPAEQGFDEWLGAFGPIDKVQPFPASVLHNGKSLKLTKNAAGAQGQLAQDFYVSEAADFLARHYRQRPIFLQVYLSTAVTPQAPDRAAAITRLDQDVGKLLKKLEELKQLSSTILIVTSATAGPAETPEKGSEGSSAPLRGGPGDLYEGGLRVPLIISGTRRIPAGQTAVVSAAWDLAPTIYDLVSAQQRPVRKSGQSLRQFVHANAKLPTRFLYWEADHGKLEIAARWQNWKVVRNADQKTFELYDLAADPGEKQDVAAQHPEVIAEIQKRITPSNEQAKR